jgi:hypothetical protein
VRAYHFNNGKTLRDGRPLPLIGEWLTHKGPLLPCESGLHASEHPFDALQYAPGPFLDLVDLDGEMVSHGNPVDKLCARRRRRVKTIDATDVLRQYARRVALDVLPLCPDAPAIVKQYLKTGDDSIRAAAWDAARDAAMDAARAAARAAARDAAWAAAWDAARAAAWDAAFAKYRQWFKEMVEEAMKDAA